VKLSKSVTMFLTMALYGVIAWAWFAFVSRI